MKNTNTAAALVICLGAAMTAHLWAQSSGSDDSDRAVGWQHLALTQDADEDMNAELSRQINELGNGGWELVDVENFIEEGTTVKTVYYFKRWQ